MAVYTPVSDADLKALLAQYEIGGATSFRGVTQGVENTNYVLETQTGKYVLTLFEKRVSEKDLPFFAGLMTHLAGKGVPAPEPVPGKDGAVLKRVCGRPAIIVTFLSGAATAHPSPEECRTVGEGLARLHQAGSGFSGERKNALGPEGWRALQSACSADADKCAPGLASFIKEELDYVLARWPQDLPRGVIHADLFPDNVFFDEGMLSGLIDFYFSCNDFLGYDIAVCLNSWANAPGGWRAENAAALLAGYQSRRPLSAEETAALPVMLRGAALRFLLTRLYDWLNQVKGAVVNVKDPLEYRDIIIMHRAQPFSSVIRKT